MSGDSAFSGFSESSCFSIDRVEAGPSAAQHHYLYLLDSSEISGHNGAVIFHGSQGNFFR
jgi:hypothetical protein